MLRPYFKQVQTLASRSISNVVQHNPQLLGEPDVKPTIGLEVHAQLNIKSKLFSTGANSSSSPPNTQVDYLDICLPGSMPRLNSAAIDSAITAALGLNCSIQDVIHFDRKNYFYTDMPAGYQITQYNNPLAKQGYLDFLVTNYHHSRIAHSHPYDVIKYVEGDDRRRFEGFKPYLKRSHIKQIQLEQDSAKTMGQTMADGITELNNLIDYNRSGSALIEIVFEPDLTDPNEASALVRELILLLRRLNVCDGQLQEGSLRVDANVSINSINGQVVDREISRRVELKNLNSLKALCNGIKSEIKRQSKLIMNGQPVIQESRSYDSRKDKTSSLRLKEESVDYRYMPEPNVPPLCIGKDRIDAIATGLPHKVLPHNVRAMLQTVYSLNPILVVELFDEPGLSEYFDKIMDFGKRNSNYDPDTVADFLIYTVANLRKAAIGTHTIDLLEENGTFLSILTVEKMQNLLDCLYRNEISFINALDVMRYMILNEDAADLWPLDIVRKLDLKLISDEMQIRTECDSLVKGMKNISKKYFKTGEARYLRMMLEKLTELQNGRMDLPKAIDYINELKSEYEKTKK